MKFAKNKDCTFYILKCFNENEEFYKIGITSKSVKDRYNNKLNMPYSFTILTELKDSAEKVWDMEYTLKNKLSNFKYSPLITFNGSKTECFTNL